MSEEINARHVGRLPAEPPLVSCLMPTRGRRPFVAQAIRYFERQDYPEKELVVADDGEDPVRDLIPDDPRVRYLRCEPMRLGAKRNLCCREARGRVLVHWDDDDWSAPWRLSYQVASLLESGADICGLAELYFYDPVAGKAWEYAYPRSRKAWVAGGTLCYTKSVWQRRPFPEIEIGEDNRFVWANDGARVLRLENSEFYVGLVHPGNTSRKRTAGERWRSRPAELVRGLIGGEQDFYDAFPRPRVGAEPRSFPLVSCIMPTSDRRAFVPDAIRYFERQDYPERELLVLDDGRDPIADLVPDDPRIRYVRLRGGLSVGAKRNRGCEMARGEIVAFWDDDDWYAPHRLSHQVAPLLEGRADVVVLGAALIYESSRGQFWSIAPELQKRMFYRGIIGGTQVFFHRLWREGPGFPDQSLAEEIVFLKEVEGRGARIETAPNRGAFLYVRHGANTWRFTSGRHLDPRLWRRVPRPDFLPRGDLEAAAAAAARRQRTARPRPGGAARPDVRVRRPRSRGGPPALVSCLMATGDRRGFLAQAIRCFRRQSHPAKELIVVDDGETPSVDVVPDDPRIRYLRLEERTPLGRKLNLAAEKASGRIFQKLDDDDYYHPDFLLATTSALDGHDPEHSIVACGSFLVLDAGTGELRYSGRGWFAGASLCFDRRLWAGIPFREIPKAVDYYFLKDHRAQKIKIDRPELLMVVRHGSDHLWTRMGSDGVDDFFRRKPLHSKTLREYVPKEDLEFYDSLVAKDEAGAGGGPETAAPSRSRTVVTAVVVYHDSQPWLEVLLKSLLGWRFTNDPENVHLRVLLVENPCRDDSPRIAREFVDRFGASSAIVVSGLGVDRFGGGINHSHGLAAGFKRVKPDSEWTLFLDADIVLLRDGWLDDLLGLGADLVGPPAFDHLRDYSVPHAHPSFLLFRTKLAQPPYWNGSFDYLPNPPDGSEYWDTAIPFTMEMGRRPDVKLARLGLETRSAGGLEYFRISDLALHIRGTSHLSNRPSRYSAKRDLLRLPEIREILGDVLKEPEGVR